MLARQVSQKIDFIDPDQVFFQLRHDSSAVMHGDIHFLGTG